MDFAAEMKQNLCDLHPPHMTIIISASSMGIHKPQEDRVWVNSSFVLGLMPHPHNFALFLRDQVNLSGAMNIFKILLNVCIQPNSVGNLHFDGTELALTNGYGTFLRDAVTDTDGLLHPFLYLCQNQCLFINKITVDGTEVENKNTNVYGTFLVNCDLHLTCVKPVLSMLSNIYD